MDATQATQQAGVQADQSRQSADGSGAGNIHQMPPQVDIAAVSLGIYKILYLFHTLLQSHVAHDKFLQQVVSKLQEMETNARLSSGLQHVMAQIQLHEQKIAQLEFLVDQKMCGKREDTNAKETEVRPGVAP